MTAIFVAELLRKTRSEGRLHVAKCYSQLLCAAEQKERQYLKCARRGIRFPSTTHDISESARTMRNFIYERPFSPARYVEMRKLDAKSRFCGIHQDFPAPFFRLDAERRKFMEGLAASGLPDRLGNSPKRQQLYQDHVVPPQDSDYLRKRLPMVRGKLALGMHLTYEEVGLGFSNASPQIFTICHLLNCLRKLGLVAGQWSAIKKMTDWHRSSIFLGAAPTEPDQFFSRLLLAAGFSTAAIKKARNLEADPDRAFDYGRKTHKSIKLLPLPMTTILRDYIYEKKTSLQTWHYLDEELHKSPGQLGQKQDDRQLSILALIKLLRKPQNLPQLVERLDFDYIGLTQKCNDLCHKIDIAQGKVGIGEPAKEEDLWKRPTHRGFALVAGILGDLDRVHSFKGKGKKMTAMASTTPIVDAAVEVVQEFLDGLEE